MSIRGEFIGQSIQLGFLRVIGAVLALLVNLLIARSFQPDTVGLYFISLSAIVFVSQFATLGCEKLLIRMLSASNKIEENKENLSVFFFLTLIGSLVGYIIYHFVLINVFLVDYEITIIEIYALALFYLLISVLQANNKSPLALFVNFVVQPLVFILLVIFYSGSLVRLCLISYFTCLIILSVYLLYKGLLRVGIFKISKAYAVLRNTIPYFSVLIITLFLTHLSLPLSSLWLDEESVAVMGIVIRLINVLFFIVTGTRMLLLPRFSKAVNDENRKDIAMLILWGRIMPTTIMIASFFVVWFFSENIMKLFGDNYESYDNLLVMSVLLLLPSAYLSWNQSYLIAKGRMDIINISSIIALMFTFFLLIVFTPIYGVYSSVLIVVFSRTMYSFFTSYFTHHHKLL